MSSGSYNVVNAEPGWRARNEQVYEQHQNRTQTIYRGTEFQRADAYIKSGDRQYIENRKPGDFNRQGEPAAYFAYDPRYAVKYAGSSGSVIQQTVPVDFLRGPHARVYEAEPSDEWRRRVYHDRRSERLPGRERRDQGYIVTSGPIADTHTGNFAKSSQIPPPDRFKPAKDSERNYYQQVAFKGAALDQIGQYPRSFYTR